MEDVKPPAKPVGSDSSAPAAAPLAKRSVSFHRNPIEPIIAAAKEAEEKRKQLHVDLRKHLIDANQAEANTTDEPHPMVHEHAALRGYGMVKVLDPETMTWVERPCWQMQALVAHFHAHGLRHHARISHEMFERALHEALHGRA
jgi:hypothetical protein